MLTIELEPQLPPVPDEVVEARGRVIDAVVDMVMGYTPIIPEVEDDYVRAVSEYCREITVEVAREKLGTEIPRVKAPKAYGVGATAVLQTLQAEGEECWDELCQRLGLNEQTDDSLSWLSRVRKATRRIFKSGPENNPAPTVSEHVVTNQWSHRILQIRDREIDDWSTPEDVAETAREILSETLPSQITIQAVSARELVMTEAA